jgi:hypothetical protein
VSREKTLQWDEEMDNYINSSLRTYKTTLDAAFVAADRLFAAQRNDDANAIVALIMAGWELFKLQGDVLSITRRKTKSDLTRAEQRVHDGLQSLKQQDFVYIPERTYEARQKRDNAARLKKARDDARRRENARKERTGLYPPSMRQVVEEYVGACKKKPSTGVALDKIKSHAKSIGHTGPIPTRQAVQKWIDKLLQPSGR